MSVEGKVKELKSMFEEKLKKPSSGNTPLGSKLSSGAIQGSKESLGDGTVGVAITSIGSV